LEPKPTKQQIVTEDGEVIEVEVGAIAETQSEQPPPDDQNTIAPIAFKIVAAKKRMAPQTDLFEKLIEEESTKARTPEKKKALREIRQTVLEG